MTCNTLSAVLRLAAVLAIVVAAEPDRLAAQAEPQPVLTEPAAAVIAAPAETAPAAEGAAALQAQPIRPAAAQPPRTLRAYWHLFIAFAVTWLLLFGYTLTVGRRWARLERELQELR
jgi:CcmD family protein